MVAPAPLRIEHFLLRRLRTGRLAVRARHVPELIGTPFKTPRCLGSGPVPPHMRRPSMLRTFATVTAVSALMLSGALAQSTTQPGDNPAMSPPAATAPAPSAQPAAPKGDMSKVQIINAQSPDQWLASKFKG